MKYKPLKSIRKFAQGFRDGVQNLFSALQNSRNALNNNIIESRRMSYSAMREIFKSGIGNKIISIKAGHALRDSIQFSTDEDKRFYETTLEQYVKQATTFMLAFGRGIIVIVENGKDLDEPLSEDFYTKNYKLEVFSGDLVTATDASYDLLSPFFYKPRYYAVRGYQFHHSRVIDFTYKRPPQIDLPAYYFGGISEFQLIESQLVTAGIVERAGATILERNSSLFYKVKDMKDLLGGEQEKDLIAYMNATENNRSIYGAGLIDGEDDAFVLNQSLADFDKVDTMSLRRLSLVTNIPLTWMIGENAQGLNSSGDNENEIFWFMIKDVRENYAKPKINLLLAKFDRKPITFKEKNDLSPNDTAQYESRVIDNAYKLHEMGLNSDKYLRDKDIIKDDPLSLIFNEDD